MKAWLLGSLDNIKKAGWMDGWIDGWLDGWMDG
jgi:hypothetical protein